MIDKIKTWLEKATQFYIKNNPGQSPDRKSMEVKRQKMNIHYYTVIYAKLHKGLRLSLMQKRDAQSLNEMTLNFPHKMDKFAGTKLLTHP